MAAGLKVIEVGAAGVYTAVRMTPSYPSLRDASLEGKRVFLRAGFDVGIENGVVTDTTRIDALVPTMQHILHQGAALIIAAHEGRPKGKADPAFSQRPLVPILEKVLGTTVRFANSPGGDVTVAAAKQLKPGEVLLLENLRYDPREESNDPAFAKELAACADVYVNDAFTNCHRSHASMVGVPALLPSYMGLQLEEEVTHLSKVTDRPARPLALIISGAKMETKVPIVENFLDKGDDILLGGAIANTFIAARGFDVGTSKCEPERFDTARDLLARSEKPGQANIRLPRDVVIASAPDATSDIADLPLEDIKEGDAAIFDIGKMTIQQFVDIIGKAKTVVWNGPLGLYENEHFAGGSKAIAAAVRDATTKGAVTVIGGGDTIDFHTRYGIPMDGYTFVSTGGGAMLEFVSGKTLPALAALVR